MTLLALLLPTVSLASSAGTDEMLSEIERVPPTVVFVLDMSADMSLPCDSSSTTSCFEDAVAAINGVVRHFDWAQYGVVGTAESAGNFGYTPIAPVGSSYAEISSALAALSPYSSATRNISEVVYSLNADYFSISTAYENESDDDGDNMTGDWAESPVEYACSDTYVIVLARDRPVDDDQTDDIDGQSTAWAYASVPGDVVCDASGTSSVEFECFLDNIAYHGWGVADMQSSLSGQQNLVVNVVGLNVPAGSIGDNLYQNLANVTGGATSYTNAVTGDDILSGVLDILSDVQSGIYSRSSPVITADGDYMIYTWYEITGTNPLPEGHVRAYAIDNDPASPYYGQLTYDGPAEYGGAVWDGGDLLVSRLVLPSESNPDDRDGVGQRDIYFFDDDAWSGLASMRSEAGSYSHMGFDADFVNAIRVYPTSLDNYLDTTVDPSNPSCALNRAYDLDEDCAVDADDLQALVDFVRGLPEARFRYVDMERGRWKLADSPYAVPVVVSARNDAYSTDRTYQAFIDALEAEGVPSVVILPANDGMLHAFRLEDDPMTGGEDEAGEELWAWIPGYVVQRSRNEEWTSGLLDLMWYGKSFLFDGSPAVEDVWIDDDGDGAKSADEWHRVLVVQQGLGGPVTLALDITDTRNPLFLWEQTNTTDHTAMGYTMGTPSIVNVYESGHDPSDRWVAMWGGGRAVGFTGAAAYYRTAEPNLYMWAIADATNTGYGATLDANSNGQADLDTSAADNYSVLGDNVGSEHPDPSGYASGLNYDSDSALEYGYISASLALVDTDQDGDVDVGYFPMTTSYRPADEGGGGKSDVQDPGSSWIFKVLFNATDPDDLTWCEFYDPQPELGARPEVFYAATTAWMTDGSLGVYWGTGTPFDRSGTQNGYFFAMKDPSPTSCTPAEPMTCDGNPGYYQLPNSGESLTSSPIVYAGVVYFTTYAPNADQCQIGEGRLYGLYYDDCSGGIDDDGDGVGDEASTDPVEGFLSQPTVTEMGTVMYGSATPTTDGSENIVETISAVGSTMLGTRTMAWMEMM